MAIIFYFTISSRRSFRVRFSECFLMLSMVGCWAAGVTIITDTYHRVAYDPEDHLVNGNAFYFSWAGFVSSAIMLLMYVRDCTGKVDYNQGENQPLATTLSLWLALALTSIVVAVSSSTCDYYGCQPRFRLSQWFSYSHAIYGKAVGSISFILSLLMITRIITNLLRRIPRMFDYFVAFSLTVIWIVAVSLISLKSAPSMQLGNLYYSVWLSLLISMAILLRIVNIAALLSQSFIYRFGSLISSIIVMISVLKTRDSLGLHFYDWLYYKSVQNANDDFVYYLLSALIISTIVVSLSGILVFFFIIPPIRRFIEKRAKAEGVLIVFLSCCWAADLITITDAIGGVAMDSDGNIVNGNMYYFSWAGFFCTIALFLTYNRAQSNSRSGTLRIWSSLVLSSSVVMTTSIINLRLCQQYCEMYGILFNCSSKWQMNYYQIGPDNLPETYCMRTFYGIILGAASIFLSLKIIILHLFLSQKLILIEAICLYPLTLAWIVGVFFITSRSGPGRKPGNLYYFTWLSLLFALIRTFSVTAGLFRKIRQGVNWETTIVDIQPDVTDPKPTTIGVEAALTSTEPSALVSQGDDLKKSQTLVAVEIHSSRDTELGPSNATKYESYLQKFIQFRNKDA